MVLPRFKPTQQVEPQKTESTLEKQGTRLVTRNAEGHIEKATSPITVQSRKNWRKFARELGDDGVDGIRRLWEISQGQPFRVQLPDGRYSDWEIPTLETQRAAAKDYHELVHGKAVAQTEVLKALRESEDVEKYRALSDDALREFIKRVESGEEVDAEFTPLLKSGEDEE